MNTALAEEIRKITDEFNVDKVLLDTATTHFINQLKANLQTDNVRGLPMIPTFVTSIPTGLESGLYLACDLGGTNFRVCSVDLKGDHTFDLKQKKYQIPLDLMKSTSVELFEFLSGKIKIFLNEHHQDLDTVELKMGFTFSFPVDQKNLDCGYLLRWTKGFNIPDAIGEDIVKLLQTAIDKLGLPIKVVALANDTVGTLLSRAYVAGGTPGGSQGECKIGCIFGTGTNGAYFEKLENIGKLDGKIKAQLIEQGVEGMVINTEWGSFDNDLEVLPVTKYDTQLDQLTENPGFHLFEKRISGMFLGELLRLTMVDLHSRGLLLQQFKQKLPHRVTTPWELDTEVLSHIEIDDSTNLKETELSLLQALRLPTTHQERIAIQILTRAIAKRAAYLSSIPIAAILIHTNSLDSNYKEVEIGVDGSVVEYYPGFKGMVRDALAEGPIGQSGERRVHICIAKDGSGVGVALCASVV